MSTRKRIRYPDPTSEYIHEVFVRLGNNPAKKPSLVKCKSKPNKTTNDVQYKVEGSKIDATVKEEIEDALLYLFPNTKKFIQ